MRFIWKSEWKSKQTKILKKGPGEIFENAFTESYINAYFRRKISTKNVEDGRIYNDT